MTFEQYQQNFNNLIADLQGGAMANVLVSVAKEAEMMIKDRIQEFGTNAEGRNFRDYTASYKKRKQKAGKYKGYTDFSFTNRMWTNTQLSTSIAEAGEDVGKATIAPLSEENKNKMKVNSERFGEIMEVSKEELENLNNTYNELILEIWRKHGLSFSA